MHETNPAPIGRGTAVAALLLLITMAGVLAPRPAGAAIAVRIRAGFRYTCAQTSDGHLRCFGGSLSGTGLPPSINPAEIAGFGAVASFDVGNAHVCVVTTAGGVKCLGENLEGQLGDGTETTRTTPVDVAGLTSGVTAVATGVQRTCALLSGGGVKCWGETHFGHSLGDGTTSGSTVPVDVVGLGGPVVSLSSGLGRTCAVTAAGGVKCWGAVGPADATTPVDIAGLSSGIAAVAAGTNFDCALTDAGGVKCWSSVDSVSDVAGLTGGVVALDTVNRHVCAVLATGGVECWGENQFNQLGDATNVDRPDPVPAVGVGDDNVGVATGYDHTCSLGSTGNVRCWGYEYGQFFAVDQRLVKNIVDLGPPVCSIVDPGQIFLAKPTPRLVLTHSGGSDLMTASGAFALPPGVRFADVDPLAQGVRLQLRTTTGDERADLTTLSGAYDPQLRHGWKRSPSGNAYTFLSTAGIRRIQVVDRSHDAPGGTVSFNVRLVGAYLPVFVGDEPVELTMILGDDTAGPAGECGKSAFVAGDCAFNEPGTRLKCKK
jgi:hypothetical protein